MPPPKQIRVGGNWLSRVGAWGELTWSSKWGGGPHEASWKMDLPTGFQHPSLVRGAKVEIMDGPVRIWYGLLAEPNRSDWSFTAYGMYREGEHYLALSGAGGGTPSSTPDTAVDRAITDGLPWIRRASISSAAFAGVDNTDGMNSVTALLDAYADRQGKRWIVDAQGVVQLVSDPTTPTWHLTPGAHDLGVADDEYASHVYVRYKDWGTNTTKTSIASDLDAAARFGRREYGVDARDLGPIPASRGDGIASGIVTKGKARLGWTNGLEVTAYELTNAGGVPADLSAVEAGQMVRIHGLYDDTQFLSGRPYLDVVLGDVAYTDGAETVQLTPLNTAARTLSEIAKQQMRAATKGLSAFGKVKG